MLALVLSVLALGLLVLGLIDLLLGLDPVALGLLTLALLVLLDLVPYPVLLPLTVLLTSLTKKLPRPTLPSVRIVPSSENKLLAIRIVIASKLVTPAPLFPSATRLLTITLRHPGTSTFNLLILSPSPLRSLIGTPLYTPPTLTAPASSLPPHT